MDVLERKLHVTIKNVVWVEIYVLNCLRNNDIYQYDLSVNIQHHIVHKYHAKALELNNN